jgi:alpha-1,4-digalacturonate transport system substrate-binding protein
MKLRLFILLALLIAMVGIASAQDEAVELRITWYNDGNEGEVFQALLDQFEEANPGISVVLDTIAYGDTYHTTIQAQVEAGTPPDLARVNDVARFAGSYLDLTDLVADSEYYTTNFSEAVLDSMRSGDEDEGIYGYPLQYSVTIPYINRTLFEQAGVAVPSDENPEATWDEWIAAAQEVAAATETPYAIGFDPRGHRFWAYAVAQGAEFFDEEGNFVVDSEGFRTAAQNVVNWQLDGLMPPESWATADLNIAKDAFVNGQVVFYYSGSWQLNSFIELIGDTFDFEAVPNPSGPGGSTATPGGSLLVAFEGTEHPEEVALLMDYLTGEEAQTQFALDAAFIPGHIGLAEAGLEYETAADAFNVFLAEVPKVSDQTAALQYSPYSFTYNRPIDQRLSQVMAGELTLDEAIVAIQEDVETAITAAEEGS